MTARKEGARYTHTDRPFIRPGGMYWPTAKADALLDGLAGTEQGGSRAVGEAHRRSVTPSRPSHQMFTNALRCPGCGSEGFVVNMTKNDQRYRWRFHCTAKCLDRWYLVQEVGP